MKYIITLLSIVFLIVSCVSKMEENIGQTTITKWQGDKKSAISITYDDGIINQFTVARPIMNKLGLPATFYVITGKVDGSAKGKFIGRPNNEIIAETASIKTNADNFFERASLIAFTGTDQAVEYHSSAGGLFERGKITEAYELIDEGYEKLRNGQLKNTNEVVFHNNSIDTSTWDDFKNYAAEGHEIASHTVTHARLAVLDEANLLYELEQSKADVQKYLGEEYIFSAECPYGTENERVMEYAHQLYPALRNRMPASYLDELNRGSKEQPGESTKEYVQWQRGPLTDISMEVMKSWVDTCIAHDNIWLVLVFHGIDGIGWESRTGAELETYFSYIKEKEDELWVATFADVTKYIRERKNAVINSKILGDKIEVDISSDLDSAVYDVPLTLKTYVPEGWKTIVLKKFGEQESQLMLPVQKDALGSFVIYAVLPNAGKILLSKQKDL
ncbi:MAG: peptidoglycan/xylan/chitin deacetylase (PgdA/CDA1 family) [Saprospiraceae bacterium]|jgi:peptidoglycan/xylan/chitin deacetylase (PgdA/CDA1 family)